MSQRRRQAAVTVHGSGRSTARRAPGRPGRPASPPAAGTGTAPRRPDDEDDPGGAEIHAPAPPSGRSPGFLLATPHLVLGLVVVDLAALLVGIGRYGRLTPNTLLIVGFAIWLLAVGDHYRLRFHLSVLDEVPGLVARVVVALSLGAAYREFVSGHDAFTADRLRVFAAAAALVVLGRAGAYAAIRAARRRGLRQRSVVAVADEATTRTLSQALEVAPDAGLRLAASVPSSAELTGPIAEGVDLVVADAEATDRAELTRLLGICDRAGAELHLLAPSLSLHQSRHRLDHIGWLPVLPVRPALRSITWPLKRLIDIVVGTVFLLAAAPVILLSAGVLRIQSGPGVFFRQERVGLNGRRFTIVKLRTIAPADQRESESSWYDGSEPVSGFARFLRVSSLDELPQLWNVVRGDMSLVGPRPERPHFAERFSASIPDYADRHRVPAGLTGLAQIHGLRGDTSISERARLDNAYIDSWSLYQDAKILVRTLSAVVSRRGRGW